MPSEKCPHCGLVNPDTAQRCDCGYDCGTRQVDPEMLASALSRRRRRVTIIVLAVLIPVLVYLLLTSTHNYGALSNFLIAGAVLGIVLLNLVRWFQLDRRAQRSLGKLKPPRP